jgi:thymidylate synthase (FAD)
VSEDQIKVELIHSCGDDLTVVNAARVSFDKESEWEWIDWGFSSAYDIGWKEMVLKEKDKKLIQYLAKHVHLSPFGHCFASFRVTAPVFVARQLVKHKFLRWNEVSRRYVDSPPEFYTPDVWRGRAEDKKQGSGGEVELGDELEGVLAYTEISSLDSYNMLLEAGVCPEQARMMLPQSLMTTWWWSGSMDAFANMCHLRCKEDTQYETRLVANEIDYIMSNLYPVSWEALRAYAE